MSRKTDVFAEFRALESRARMLAAAEITINRDTCSPGRDIEKRFDGATAEFRKDVKKLIGELRGVPKGADEFVDCETPVAAIVRLRGLMALHQVAVDARQPPPDPPWEN